MCIDLYTHINICFKPNIDLLYAEAQLEKNDRAGDLVTHKAVNGWRARERETMNVS